MEVELCYSCGTPHHHPVEIIGNLKPIFRTTTPASLPLVLFGLPDWKSVDERWIEACVHTFRTLPKLEGPYKKPKAKTIEVEVTGGYVVGKRKMFIKVYDDEGIKFLDYFVTRLERTMQYLNRRTSYKTLIDAVNILRNVTSPFKQDLIEALGRFRFDLLVSIGLLHSVKLWTERKHVYYVSQAWRA
ncbi:hypothetical protein J7L81_00715 [Candidatus Aerophobetes bacterium]|nr:hypothetical protein [Candidatus Aerophobetes bacterium]